MSSHFLQTRSTSFGALAAAVGLLALAGCGTDEEPERLPAATTAAPAATAPGVATDAAPTAPDPPATTAAPERPATTDPEEATPDGRAEPSPEDRVPGGPGDEEPIRVPAEFTADGARLEPGTVSVPAYLPVRVIVRSGDGRAHRVEVRGDGVREAFRVPADGRGGVTLEGRGPGETLTVRVDGRAAGTVEPGFEPGP